MPNLKTLALLISLLLLVGLVFALHSNKALVSVGSGYAAKTVCSNYYVAGRDPNKVLKIDVQAPGHPLLKLARLNINKDTQTISASLLGLGWAAAHATHTPGYGCRLIPNAQQRSTKNTAKTTQLPPSRSATALWKPGPQLNHELATEIEELVSSAMQEPGTRAVFVAHRGQMLAEEYAPGFTALTPQIGWSLSKTVTALLAGILADEGLLDAKQSNLLAQWQADKRKDITFQQLLNMESGLTFKESYGKVSDVTRMLFLETDMANFALQKELQTDPGKRFEYSSGTTNIVMQILRERMNDEQRWVHFPQQALFTPLGIQKAIFETDASGNYIGSSYLFATAREWARIGQLMLQGGSWNGKQLISRSWINNMITPSARSNGEYAGHVWLRGEKSDAGFDLPDDAFWLLGHDSQSVAVIPSKELVVVRLGLTNDKGFRPQRFVQALLNSNWAQYSYGAQP